MHQCSFELFRKYPCHPVYYRTRLSCFLSLINYLTMIYSQNKSTKHSFWWQVPSCYKGKKISLWRMESGRLHNLNLSLGPPASAAGILSVGHQSKRPKIPTNQYYFHSELPRPVILFGHFYWFGSLKWDLHMNSFVGTLCIWLWRSNVKILVFLMQGSKVRILSVKYNIFSSLGD